MIASVRGVVLEKADGLCVVEAGGVGYAIQVSTATLASVPEPGGEVRLHTRHIVREDAQQLFGFLDPLELRLFDLLIGVNGVGPRIAIAVLSGLAPARFARAVRDEDLAALTAVSGVGRKTAERLVIELRDKLAFLPMAAPALPAASGKGSPAGRRTRVLEGAERWEDAVAALVTLGYSPPQATETVRRVAEDTGEGASTEDVVRRALAVLSRGARVAR